jgi:cobalt/nickel transport system permease protein
MHIPYGATSNIINIFAYLISTGICVYAVKKISREPGEKRIPLLLGISGVFLLFIQMIPFPVNEVASVHFLGALLLASMLGPWASCLIITIVLIIQRLIFGFGSLTTLGVNVLNLGVLGGIGGYYLLMTLKKLFPHGNKGYRHALAASTWGATMIITLVFWAELKISGVLKINLFSLLGVQSLVGLAETIFTVGLVSLMVKARPDLVLTHCCGGDKDSCYAHHHHVKTHTHDSGKEHDHGHVY